MNKKHTCATDVVCGAWLRLRSTQCNMVSVKVAEVGWMLGGSSRMM